MTKFEPGLSGKESVSKTLPIFIVTIKENVYLKHLRSDGFLMASLFYFLD